MKNRRFHLCAIALLTTLGGGVNAYAGVDIYVKNCTSKKVSFSIYNGEDGFLADPYKTFNLDGLAKGKSDATAKKTNCKIGCTWFNPNCSSKKCQVTYVLSNSVDDMDGNDVKENKYFILKSVKKKRRGGDNITRGSYVTSSSNKKCSEVK
ncbi:MAG: hypothetical protein AAFX54_03075 [Pseudomonadota bacterium]